jgi:hypothetical protein
VWRVVQGESVRALEAESLDREVEQSLDDRWRDDASYGSAATLEQMRQGRSEQAFVVVVAGHQRDMLLAFPDSVDDSRQHVGQFGRDQHSLN